MAAKKSPEDFWRRSAIETTTETREEGAVKVHSSGGGGGNTSFVYANISQLHGGSSTSVVYTAISQLPPQDRAGMLTKLVRIWPDDLERAAFLAPMRATILATMASSAFVTTAVNRDFLHFGVPMGFVETVKKSPRAPFVMSVCAAGITHHMLNQNIAYNALYNTDQRPSGSYLLRNAVLTGICCGILVPTFISTIQAYNMICQDNKKYPDVRNLLEFGVLISRGLIAARPLVPQLIGLQVVVAAASTYTILWAHNRIFDTMDAEPDLVKDLLIKAQAPLRLHERVMEFLRPFLP